MGSFFKHPIHRTRSTCQGMEQGKDKCHNRVVSHFSGSLGSPPTKRILFWLKSKVGFPPAGGSSLDRLVLEVDELVQVMVFMLSIKV